MRCKCQVLLHSGMVGRSVGSAHPQQQFAPLAHRLEHSRWSFSRARCQVCMKSLEEAITDKCKKQGKQAAELTCLELDATCKASSLQALAPLANLEVLSLSCTSITNLSTLPPLPKLKTLVLSDNRLGSDSLQYLTPAALPCVSHLDLAGNANLKTYEKLKPLQQLTTLKRLALTGCPVRDLPDSHSEIFKMIKDLEYLDNVDKAGVEREADDDDEEEEVEGDEGGDGGEEAAEGDDDEEEGEEAGAKLHAALLEEEPLEDDEEDYVDEGEDEDSDEEEEEEEEEEGAKAGGSSSAEKSGKKRKRDDKAKEEGDEEDE